MSNQNSEERYLILSADDYGASININEGIKNAADNKLITTISALTNFTDSLPGLKNISENHPDISIGVHLNITTGKPILEATEIPTLVNSIGNFHTIEQLLPKIKSISLEDLRKELRAQIRILTKFNIMPDYISDQHGIIFLYNPFFEIIMDLAKEFNVAVRSPVIAGIRYPDEFRNSHIKKHGLQIALRLALTSPLKSIGLLKYSRKTEMLRKVRKLNERGIPHPDLLIESFWGNPTTQNFSNILNNIPKGCSEIIFHIGSGARQDYYPSGLDLNYFKKREQELITLSGFKLKEQLHFLNIRAIGYSEISNSTD